MFTVMAIRTADDEDGTVYPLVGDDACVIELEDSDGGPPVWHRAKKLTVNAFDGDATRGKRTLSLEDVDVDFGFTESRFLVAVEKWTKGGGWIGMGVGGVAFALAANAVSKARAKHRRKGKFLLGQMRFEWIVRVGYSDRESFRSPAAVQVQCVANVDGDARRHVLLIEDVRKDVDATVLGQALIKKVAAHRLANSTTLTADDRATLQTLVAEGETRPPRKQYRVVTIPGHTTLVG